MKGIIGWIKTIKPKEKLKLKTGAEMMKMIGLLMRLLLNYAFSKSVEIVAGLFKRRAKTALRNIKPPASRDISYEKKP